MSNCVPAFFTAIRLVVEAGEVVCLEACLGGHGKGEGVYTGAEVGRQVYRMRSGRPFKALFRTVRTRPSMAPESTLPKNPHLLKWRSMSLLLMPLMLPTPFGVHTPLDHSFMSIDVITSKRPCSKHFHLAVHATDELSYPQSLPNHPCVHALS